ncbi:hypothetical protein ACMFMG_011539 [Clarireedia jacksonii]
MIQTTSLLLRAGLIILALPLTCRAWNQTHFEFYKNTHFGPCAIPPSNATTPIPDVGSGVPLPTNANLSSVEFCNRFWNYTVLPSVPEDGAFSLTWLNVFVNIVLWIISNVALMLWYKKQDRDGELDDLDSVPLVDPSCGFFPLHLAEPQVNLL